MKRHPWLLALALAAGVLVWALYHMATDDMYGKVKVYR